METISENPKVPVREIKTLKRRDEDAQLRLKIKKRKTTELPLEIDEVRKLLFFSLEENISMDKIIFLDEKNLENINNGTFRRKYINEMKNNPRGNFKIQRERNRAGKIKVSYENLGEKLYLVLLDNNYEVKKIYRGKYQKKSLESNVKSKITMWIFGEDLDKISNLIITPELNGWGNFLVRPNSEDSYPEYSRERKDTYSTYDMSGKFLYYDFDEEDVLRIVPEKETTVIKDNLGSFYEDRNKYSQIEIVGYRAKVKVWSEYNGVELSLEKNAKRDGISRFKLIHETRDGKLLQEISFEIYINNQKIDEYFRIKNNTRQIHYNSTPWYEYIEIPTDINIYNFYCDEIRMEQMPEYTMEKRFGETGEIIRFQSNWVMKYSKSGNETSDSYGRINYNINKIKMYLDYYWFTPSAETAQFFTGYGLNVLYGKSKRRINIPGRLGIFTAWNESTEKIEGIMDGLPLLGKPLNKDNINGIPAVDFRSSHFEYIMAQNRSKYGVKILGNGKTIYSSEEFSDKTKFKLNNIEYGLKYEYRSSNYDIYSIHIKRMKLENFLRDEHLKGINDLGGGKNISKDNRIYIPPFDPSVLINRYNSSIEDVIYKQEEVSPELLEHNMGKIISLGTVYFYQLNPQILRDNSSKNPKIKLGEKVQLRTGNRVTYRTIEAELSFSPNKNSKVIEMDMDKKPTSGEGGEIFLKISPGEYEKLIKNGGNVTYELEKITGEICEVYFLANRSPIGDNDTREFRKNLISRVILKTKAIRPSTGDINFKENEPLLKGGKIALKNGKGIYVEMDNNYDYNRTFNFLGNVSAYDYNQKKHNVDIIDGKGTTMKKIIGSNGSGAYWHRISLGDENYIDLGYGKNDDHTYLSLNQWNFQEAEGTVIIKHYVGASDSISQYYVFKVKVPKFNPLIYYDENKTLETLKIDGKINVSLEKNKNKVYLGEINLKNYNWEITKISSGNLRDEIGLRIEANENIKILDENGRKYRGKIILEDIQGEKIDYYNSSRESGKVYLEILENLSGNMNYVIDEENNEYLLRIGRNQYFKNILKEIKINKGGELQGRSTIEIEGDYISKSKLRFNSTTGDMPDEESKLLLKPRGINLKNISGSAPLKVEKNDRIKIYLEERLLLDEILKNSGNLEERGIGSQRGILYFGLKNGNIELAFERGQKFQGDGVDLKIEVERDGNNVMTYNLGIEAMESWIIIDNRENIDFGKVLSDGKNHRGAGSINFRTSPDITREKIKISLSTENPLLYGNSGILEGKIEEISLGETSKNDYLLNLVGNVYVGENTISGDYVGTLDVNIEVVD
ncbi:MAG: hypothetical protein ACRC1R_04990 [Cetobacterium sp.]|uniref:hypothetical protein n=1 Tax=Cetobacterium sp. TaxID=2071632 RepID=UPI003F410CCC